MRKNGLVTASLTAMLLAVSALPASASEPEWDTYRLMTCDDQPVSARFAPGGIFTAFHVDGSTDVMLIKHLEIFGYFQEGVWTTTRDVPGFGANGVGTVHCTYVDSRGFPIRLDAVRT